MIYLLKQPTALSLLAFNAVTIAVAALFFESAVLLLKDNSAVSFSLLAFARRW